jgi:hypothetical protein
MSTHDQWETEQEALAGMGDGLPLVPPSRERVETMLKHNGVDGDEVVVTLAPAFGEATWRGIAENAVMAGCRPEYLGVIGAALSAMAESEYNLLGIQTTTGSAAPITIVNGPIAAKIGMNAAGNALGPGNRANATIGRAISLALRNIGGAKPGEMDMATLGHPGKYTFCLAENEEASPWLPLHVTRGFARNHSAVTVAGAAGIIEVVDSVSSKPEDLIRTFASSMVYAGSVGNMGMMGSGQPLIIMPPEQALHFHQDGMSREDVQEALLRDAGLPLERLSNAVRERVVAHRRSAGLEADAPVRIATQASDILIVVAGGHGVKAAYIPTWGGSRAVTREITVQAA